MRPLWELTVRLEFSAAHQLREYGGKCERLHGHNWTVEGAFQCRRLDVRGLAVDFKDLREETRQVLETLDHSLLNEQPPFAVENPSAENIARYIYRELSKRLAAKDCRVGKVTVYETPDASAAYWEEGDATV